MNIRFACVALIGTLSVPLTAEGNDFDMYFFGGLTIFPEGTSVELASEEGYGNRWGMGFQINNFLGLEIARDSAPALDDLLIVEFFEQDFAEKFTNYEIETTYNRFSSLVGTFSVPISNSTTIIGKVGYANYSYKSKVDFQSNNGFQFSGTMEEDFGLSPTASLAIDFPFRQRFGPSAGIEFALTKVFEEEIESTWGTVSFRFGF